MATLNKEQEHLLLLIGREDAVSLATLANNARVVAELIATGLVREEEHKKYALTVEGQQQCSQIYCERHFAEKIEENRRMVNSPEFQERERCATAIKRVQFSRDRFLSRMVGVLYLVWTCEIAIMILIAGGKWLALIAPVLAAFGPRYCRNLSEKVRNYAIIVTIAAVALFACGIIALSSHR